MRIGRVVLLLCPALGLADLPVAASDLSAGETPPVAAVHYQPHQPRSSVLPRYAMPRALGDSRAWSMWRRVPGNAWGGREPWRAADPWRGRNRPNWRGYAWSYSRGDWRGPPLRRDWIDPRFTYDIQRRRTYAARWEDRRW